MSSVVIGPIPKAYQSYETTNPDTEFWRKEAFPLVCKNLDRVLLEPRMFWSVPPGSKVGFSFGGSFPVPIGVWALAWSKDIGVYACARCGGKAFSLAASGGMSMGSSRGICSECGEDWESRDWSIGTWGFLRKELLKRVDALDLSEGLYPDACDFRELVAQLAE